METFSQQGKKEMPSFVIKAIQDLLEVLKSPIVYPTDRYGFVLEFKLLAVVKAREDVYSNMIGLMELIDIESELFKRDIINGLKTTWRELTKITTRNIGEIKEDDDEDCDYTLDEMKRKLARATVEDNYLSNISKAKYISAKVAFDILERIERLENPDSINDAVLNQNGTGNIIERYAEH